jgi:hypothetical protein
VVAGPVGEHAAERKPDARADRRDRTDERDAGRHALGGKLVADDPERQRQHAAAQALQAPADDHRPQRAGQRADQRTGGEQRERERQEALLAEHVAEASEDRRGDRGDQEVGGHHPRDALGGRAELALQVTERRDDRRLGQDEGQTADAQDEQRARRCLSRMRVHELRVPKSGLRFLQAA